MDYLKTISLPIIIGYFIGGLIDYIIPNEYISKLLSANKKTTLFKSALLGFLMSTCSHGILALTIQLYKKGASTAAVITFLLASPWANFPLTVLLFGFFGAWRALYIIFAALVVALIVGFIYQLLEKKSFIPRNPNTVNVHEDFHIWSDLKLRWRNDYSHNLFSSKGAKGILKGAWSLADMTLAWMIFGIILAAAAGAYVPHTFFHQYLGADIKGLLATLGFATVIEVCSEGTAPLAFEIYKHTGALGSSFVFLLAGVITDYTEIGLIWSNVGKKQAILLPLISIPFVILLAILANHL
jgi:uncharacterized membrane protein YraQ (UPF0718 family)